MEVRVSMPAAEADKERASPPSPELWLTMLRFLALRVADAVVYAMCAALFLVSASSALSVVGRRAGGAMGAFVTEAADFAAVAGACLFPSFIVAVPLLATFAAKKSDEAPAPRHRDEKTGSKRRPMWGFLLEDCRLALWIFYLLVAVGCLMKEILSLENGSLWEKTGSLLFDVGAVGVAVIHCCVICPKWVLDWRTGRQSSANLKH